MNINNKIIKSAVCNMCATSLTVTCEYSNKKYFTRRAKSVTLLYMKLKLYCVKIGQQSSYGKTIQPTDFVHIILISLSKISLLRYFPDQIAPTFDKGWLTFERQRYIEIAECTKLHKSAHWYSKLLIKILQQKSTMQSVSFLTWRPGNTKRIVADFY